MCVCVEITWLRINLNVKKYRYMKQIIAIGVWNKQWSFPPALNKHSNLIGMLSTHLPLQQVPLPLFFHIHSPSVFQSSNKKIFSPSLSLLFDSCHLNRWVSARNYGARLMNSIIRLGVSMSLAPFVCWENDGITMGWNRGGRKKDGGRERKRARQGWRRKEKQETEEGKQNKTKDKQAWAASQCLHGMLHKKVKE